jgi:oligoribonuclease
MPKLDEFFHYRIVDVSSIKGVIDRWYPKGPRIRTKSGHRALEDIRRSIKELRFFRENFFK